MIHTAYVNIGSNTGDRSGNLSRAVACLTDAFPEARIRASKPLESAPWGFSSENTFLNMGLTLTFEEDKDPAEVLERLLKVEKSISTEAHRNEDGTYRDRAIDIDLIAMDDKTADLPYLQLPHPRMHLREFVLLPLLELAPEWRHPRTGLCAGEMIEALRRQT